MTEVSECFGGSVGGSCWRCQRFGAFIRHDQVWCWECLEIVDHTAFEVAKQSQAEATQVLCRGR